MTAGWLVRQFTDIGLTPPRDGFRQEFPITSARLDTMMSSLTIKAGGSSRELAWGDRFYSFPQGVQPVDPPCGGLDLAFCGYGLTLPKLNRNDYGDAAAGCAVLVLDGAGGVAPDAVGPYGSPVFKAATAARAGAKMLVVVYPAKSHGDWPPEALRDKIRAAGKPVLGSGAMNPSQQAVWGTHGMSSQIIIVYLSAEALNGLLDWDSLSTSATGGNFKPSPLTGWKVRLKLDFTDVETLYAANIVGFVPGTTGQCVLVGAHYDHLGAVEGDDNSGANFYPGADDNASGVAGLLEICRRWTQRPPQRRGLVAVAFACEEDGLLGSLWLADHLPAPRDSVVAMVNMDMIGRRGFSNMRESARPDAVPDSVFAAAYYSASSPRLRDIIHSASDLVSLNLDIHPVNSFAHFGDAASFFQQQIPTIHIFSGFHSDYHQPTDTIDKLDFGKMVRMVDLTDRILKNIADEPNIITFDPAIRVEEGAPTH
jgi:hypothetical protein